MRRRRVLLLALPAFAGIVGPIAGLWIGLSRPPIHGDAQWRIEPGMTEAEVENVFGVKPGEYRRAPLSPADQVVVDREEGYMAVILRAHLLQRNRREPAPPGGQPEYTQNRWVSDRAVILIGFDDAGRVAFWRVGEFPSREGPFFSRIRRWLGF
jgi:hypothetical protein